MAPPPRIGRPAPLNRWPIGKGFDYFYGFLGGETSQREPQLYENTQPVEPNATSEQDYPLTSDLTDLGINYVRTRASIALDKPWFVYWTPGAVHVPHHAPNAYIDKYNGKFDAGWDAYRQATLTQQKALGVIPADAVLTPRPAKWRAWDSLSENAKTVYARQMEVFAGFKAQSAEPAVRQFQMGLLAQPPLGTTVVAIANDQDASHQVRINRQTPDRAIKIGAVMAQVAQIETSINAAKKVIGWSLIFKVERV